MANNKINGLNRTKDRESVRREIALACQKDGSDADLFASVLDILLSYFADSGSIDLVEDDGSITCALTRDKDGERQKMLEDHRNEHPLSLTSSYGYPRVIKTGKSQFIPGVSERIAGRLFPQAELVFDGLLVRSFLCVPLVARDHTLGALTLFTIGSGRTLDSDDLLTVEEIAAVIANALDERANRKLHQPAKDGHLQFSKDGQAQFGKDGQAQFSKDGQAQFSKDGQAQFSKDGHAQFSKGGQAQFSKDGQAQFSKDGQAQFSKDGQAQFSKDGQAQFSKDGQAQFSNEVQEKKK